MNSQSTAGSVKNAPLNARGKIESVWRNAWTKATFLAFCWAGLFIFVGLTFVVYYLVHPRLAAIGVWLDRTSIMALCCVVFVVAAGLTLITVSALTGWDLLYPHGKQSVTVKFLFPIAATLSQILGVDRAKLRASFIKVNNALTRAQRKRIRGDRILILLPIVCKSTYATENSPPT